MEAITIGKSLQSHIDETPPRPQGISANDIVECV
jgi:hypothetical protein